MKNKLSVLLLITFSFQFAVKAEEEPNFQKKWGLDHTDFKEERAAAEKRRKADEELKIKKYEFRLRVLQAQEATTNEILSTFQKDYTFNYFPMNGYLKAREGSINYHTSVLADTQRELVNLRPPYTSSSSGFVKKLTYPPEVTYDGIRYLYNPLDSVYFREVNSQVMIFASYHTATAKNHRDRESQVYKIANLKDSINEDPNIFEHINTLLNEEKKLLPYKKMGFLLEEFLLDEAKEMLISRNLKTISLKDILTNPRFYSLRETALNSLEQTMENFRRQGYILTDLVNPSEISYSSSYDKWVISKFKFHKENLFSNWSEVEKATPEKYQERFSRAKFNSPFLSCLSKYRRL